LVILALLAPLLSCVLRTRLMSSDRLGEHGVPPDGRLEVFDVVAEDVSAERQAETAQFVLEAAEGGREVFLGVSADGCGVQVHGERVVVVFAEERVELHLVSRAYVSGAVCHARCRNFKF
jgi:hypothetical protein